MIMMVIIMIISIVIIIIAIIIITIVERRLSAIALNFELDTFRSDYICLCKFRQR